MIGLYTFLHLCRATTSTITIHYTWAHQPYMAGLKTVHTPARPQQVYPHIFLWINLLDLGMCMDKHNTF